MGLQECPILEEGHRLNTWVIIYTNACRTNPILIPKYKIMRIHIEGNGGSPITAAALKLGVWSRLEARPRAKDFTGSLRFSIYDALWNLTRQWQFGEFQAEDAGTAVNVKLQVNAYPISRTGTEESVQLFNSELPLEAQVEAEPIPFDLKTQLQISVYWRKLLHVWAVPPEVYQAFLKVYALLLPVFSSDGQNTELNSIFADDIDNQRLEKADLEGDPFCDQFLNSLPGRMMNGAHFYKALKDATTAVECLVENPYEITLDPAVFNIVNTNATSINSAGTQFKSWFEKLYLEPTAPALDTWKPERLEYQFQHAIAESSQKRIAIEAKEYYHGKLDWYAYSLNEQLPSNHPLLKNDTALPGENMAVFTKNISLIPSEARFPGMPSPRLLAFEDGRTNLSKLEANTTDMASILLSQFGLLYGNDWFRIPCRLPVGGLCEISSLVVTDSFGFKTKIESANTKETGSWQQWMMFNLSKQSDNGMPLSDSRLFLPPVLYKTEEGDPVEHILFLRDEMSNMVWAIEKVIPDLFGQGQDGYEAFVKRKEFLIKDFQSENTGGTENPNQGTYSYQLMTAVAENRIPFVPKQMPDNNDYKEIRLQRGRMIRNIDGLPIDNTFFVRPHGVILSEVKPKYYIFEEEIPREGVQVTRSFQRTRWWNGKVVTWIGRKKRTGRGEGSSGLAFDRLIRNSE